MPATTRPRPRLEDRDKALVVCARVGELPCLPPGAHEVHPCFRCGARCWVSDWTAGLARAIGLKVVALCRQCSGLPGRC